jgi:hypothetical protein
MSSFLFDISIGFYNDVPTLLGLEGVNLTLRDLLPLHISGWRCTIYLYGGGRNGVGIL